MENNEEVVEKETEPIKEKKDKSLKEIKDSKLLIKIPTTEFRGRDGQMYRKIEWVEPAGEVNLGSIKEPKNEHILGFKWTAPERRKARPFEGLFGNLFGGGD